MAEHELVEWPDTPENRMAHYILSCVSEFQCQAMKAIAVSDDKRNASTSGFANGVNRVVGGGASATLFAATGGAASGPGKVVGEVLGGGVTKVEQSMEHKKAKILEKFLEGFDQDDQFEKWNNFLSDIFADIFINYNIQFLHLLQDLSDSWTKSMKKLAKDSVHRMFSQLVKEDSSQKLSKDLLIKCFLKGDSERNYSKAIKGRIDVGGEIKSGKSLYLTVDLFEKPVLVNEYEPKNKKNAFFYRHPFVHESTEHQPAKVLFDQHDTLVLWKHDVLQQIRVKAQKPKHQILESIQDESVKIRESMQQFCTEMAQKNEEERQLQSKELSKDQAKTLVMSDLGLTIIDHIDYKIANLLCKSRSHHCSDFESSSLVSGLNSSKLPMASKDPDKKVSEAKASCAMFEQIYSFTLKKVLLKNNRDDELVKKCVKIGRSKMSPVTQEELIFELLCDYPMEIEVGPFGVGMVIEATTTCSSKAGDHCYSSLFDAASKANDLYFHAKLKAIVDGDHSFLWSNESETLTEHFKFNSMLTRKGDSSLDDARKLALFPELQNQLDGKGMKKLRLFKIIRDSAEEFGDDLGVEEHLDEAARAIENVFKDGYKYSIGEIVVDPKTTEKDLLLLGKTGVGKSLLGNVLLGCNSFKVSDSTKSCTKETTRIPNHDRKIAITDTQGLLDTSVMKKIITEKSLKREEIIAKEIESFWKELAEISVHCILLVTDGSRFAADEINMVEFICNNLFEGCLTDRVLLIITKKEHQSRDASVARQWLDQESADEEAPFSKYYSLIDKDPSRAIFVNNINTEHETSPTNRRICARNNMEMAKKVIKCIHGRMDFPPVSIRGAVKNAMEKIKLIDQKLEQEEDEAKRKLLEAEKKTTQKTVKNEASEAAKKSSSCLLGSCKVLLHDFSTKPIEEIQAGDQILDGNLLPVTVLAANASFLGSRKLYQFNDNGPIFTPEHQFYSNLEHGQVGVVSKSALFQENPQLQERAGISELKEMTQLLHFNAGKVTSQDFVLNAYQDLEPSTIVYFLLTSGDNGSYIADGFVCRHELPDFDKWPLTYGAIGYVLSQCKLNLPVETLEDDHRIEILTKDLVKLWKLAIFVYQNQLSEMTFDDETPMLDFEEILKSQSSLLCDIVNNPGKMKVAQYLNMFGAKVLHDVLEDEKVSIKKRISLMTVIAQLSADYFENE